MSSALLSSLRVRLILLVLFGGLPALGLILLAGLDQRRHAMGDAQAQALMLAKSASSLQDNLIDSTRQLLFTLSVIPQVQEQNTAACSAIFANLLKRSKCYSGFMATRPDGEAFAAAPPLTRPVSVADRAWYQRLRQSREFLVSEYLIGRASGKPSLGLIYPVCDETGQLQMILIAGLDLDWFEQSIAKSSLPGKASLSVIDRNGTILARKPHLPELIGKSLPEERVKTVLNQGEGVTTSYGMDGVSRLYGFTSLGAGVRDLYILIGIPEEEAYREARKDLFFNLGCFGGVGLLALLAAWFGGNVFILRQVRGLLGLTGRLGQGDLGARAGPPYHPGELGQLAQAFDHMAASLGDRQEKLHRAQQALEIQIEERTQTNEKLTREIGERQKAEASLARQTRELARSNAELEQFAYVTSHDLQEPLRNMANYLQLLEHRCRGRLDADDEKFITRAVAAAGRMKTLINDLLLFARLGRGKPFAEVSCEQVLADALANLKAMLEESGAVVTQGPLPTVTGDAMQLVQLFQNLISNGLKFRGAEVPRIHVAAEQTGEDWLFAIQDNGIGIEPEYTEQIFGIFQRLHTRLEYPGTGIGLAICKKIVERHGGRIWVESAPNQGSTFYFTIPDQGGVQA